MPVTCPHCNRDFKGDKLNARHLSKCAPHLSPKVAPCLCGHESTSATQMKRHRTTCETWKGRDKKAVLRARQQATLEARYGEGVTNACHAPGAEERRAETNLERYGAENVFAREAGTFVKVQASLEGKRPVFHGKDNRFSQPKTQVIIRRRMKEKYGSENPQQVPEIRARTLATNLERYGHEETLAVPEIREKIVETNMERYGGVAPSCSPEVQEKARQTNLERYGVPWTAMDPEVRRKQLETMEANYGSHFFASDEGKRRVVEGMQAKYGVDYYAQIEGFWEQQVERFVAKFGVSHPLQLAEFLDKRQETCQERFGVDSPLQSPEIMAKVIATCLERYGTTSAIASDHVGDVLLERYGARKAGASPIIREKINETNLERYGTENLFQAFPIRESSIRTCLAKVGLIFPEYDTPAATEQELLDRYRVTHQMRNRDYARMHLLAMADPNAGPNGLERKVAAMAPSLMFTGNRTFWRWLPKLGHHKNPDFIVPGPDPKKPRKGVTKAVEAFGDYWHSKIFTGKAPFDHESELIGAYAEVGLECLVIWESEVKTDPENVKSRLRAFLRRS